MSEPVENCPPRQNRDSQTVTVLAPTPQDEKYCDQILREHGVAVEFATSVYEMIGRIRSGAGVLLIAQEFLSAEAMDHLRLAINEQPSWSDVPILVLLTQHETSARVIAELLSLGHVTLIERPLRIALLVSTLKAKLRDRRRQYEVRDLLLEAQQASKSKSAFVANMSHEIRTPMTSILGYAELMSDLVENEEALRYLSTIRRNGDFLLAIINDILDLSKIEAGKLDIDIERFDPVRMIEDVRSIMEIRANEKGLSLSVHYLNEIPKSIESDPKRLKQILINILGNAIKFTMQGCVRIVVRFSEIQSLAGRLDDAAAGQLCIEVIDSGIGMTHKQQERLFKPFSQGGSLITQQFGGTGLGLAISQRLASMLGGKISVDSAPDKGSTFTLRIATGESKDKTLIQPPMRTEPKSQVEPRKEVELDCHILIVDDRRDIRFLSKHIVTSAGGKVSEAEDGVQAIETVRRAASEGIEFDVILLDMQMPNMNGYDTAFALRELGYTNPIIALTADAMQGDMTKCLAAGCNNYLSKPINRAELLRMLHDLTSSCSG